MNQLAIIINKTCNICKFCDVDDDFTSLFCLKYDNKVDDEFVCNEFEVDKESCSDCLKIEEIREHEREI